MPLSVLRKEDQFEDILFERRLNILVFTVCWSLGSKMIYPAIFDLSSNPNLTHVQFYRIDIDESNREVAQSLDITSIPTIRWYFHGNKLDELIGVNCEELIQKSEYLAKVYKQKTMLSSSNHD